MFFSRLFNEVLLTLTVSICLKKTYFAKTVANNLKNLGQCFIIFENNGIVLNLSVYLVLHTNVY